MKNATLAMVLTIAIAGAGCMPNHKIQYPLDDVARVTHSPFSESTLIVKPLADFRHPLITDCSRNNVAVVTSNGKDYYYNCDVHYKTSAAAEVAKAMSDQIKSAGLFKNVAFGQDQQVTADYILTGQLARFDGLRETHMGASIAAQFALLGIPFMAMMKSDYEATTELNDMKLVRVKDGATIWSGRADGHIQGREMADPYGWSAYVKADLSLKQATQKVIDDISSVSETGVATAPTGTQAVVVPVAKHDRANEI